MKQTLVRPITSAFILAIALLSVMAKTYAAPPAHIAAPEHYQVLLDNDRVLVLKMVLKPGETDAMHYHNDETVYFQQGGKASIRTLQGKIIEAEIPDGHVMWHEAWTHEVSNIGDSDIIAIIVEQKQTTINFLNKEQR